MENNDNSYVPIHVDRLDSCEEKIPFSVFVRLGDNKFVAIFTPESGLDRLRLLKYSKKVDCVYILKSEKDIFEKFTKSSIPEEPLKKPPEDSELARRRTAITESLEAATNKTLENLLMPESVPESQIDESKNIVKNYIKVLSRDPDIVSHILANLKKSNYLFYHSLATSILSIFISRLTKQFSARLLEIVGLGGLLHDSGKIKILDEKEMTGFENNLKHSTILRAHPETGRSMFKDSKTVPEEVKQIIFQHHERPDGSGYPGGLSGPRIYYPASLVSVANAFANYIGEQPYGMGLSPRDAIRKMLDEKGRFNKLIIKTLTRLYRV